MQKIGFLGCGKIGQKMLQDIEEEGVHEVIFIQDPYFENTMHYPILKTQDETYLQKTDLVIETATADVLKDNIDMILKYSDVLIFSVTAFAEESFQKHVQDIMLKYHHKVYIPHGAILGIDGIADARELITKLYIETTKNPESLGRTDTEKIVLYDGPTREACRLYPRNVNVHATIALAGIGFDETWSRIIADPSVSTNTHKIIVEGEGIYFELLVNSFSNGGVTGKYTPFSAVGSLRRILAKQSGLYFI